MILRAKLFFSFTVGATVAWGEVPTTENRAAMAAKIEPRTGEMYNHIIFPLFFLDEKEDVQQEDRKN